MKTKGELFEIVLAQTENNKWLLRKNGNTIVIDCILKSDTLPSCQFTESELTEIMGGAILKRIPGGTPLDDLGKDKSCYVWIEDCNYWKNPLIELVPVEDGE